MQMTLRVAIHLQGDLLLQKAQAYVDLRCMDQLTVFSNVGLQAHGMR